MKRLLELPRKWRDLIGGVTVLSALALGGVLFGSEGALVFVLPFVIFFAWLCPETWGGK